jgi:hypothetical protein
VARKPNYGQQRAEVNRSKQAKQNTKQREREAEITRRKVEREAHQDLLSGDQPPTKQE